MGDYDVRLFVKLACLLSSLVFFLFFFLHYACECACAGTWVVRIGSASLVALSWIAKYRIKPFEYFYYILCVQ